MPAPQHVPLNELKEIARRLCIIAAGLTRTSSPADISVGGLRQFAAEQREAGMRAQYLGVLDAIVICAEEMADYDVRDEREDVARRMREGLRSNLVSVELARRYKELHDHPFAYPDPRVIVFRAPAKIRLAKALGGVTPHNWVVARITEPYPEASQARTFNRARGRRANKAQAKSNARSQSRGTVLRRLSSKSADRYLVVANAAEEGSTILGEWARLNGYSCLKVQAE